MGREPLVCIVDDDDAIREAIRLLLFADGLGSCAYESADAFLQDENVPAIDCLLLDIRMPGMDGIDLFQRLKRERRAFPIIFITGHGDIPLAVTAIKQGAYDFLTKPFQDGELLSKVRSAISQHRASFRQLHELQELQARLDSCTPREREVMMLLAQGLSNKGIAEALGISPRTVETHRAHVMNKMAAESLPALTRMIARLENDDSTS